MIFRLTMYIDIPRHLMAYKLSYFSALNKERLPSSQYVYFSQIIDGNKMGVGEALQEPIQFDMWRTTDSVPAFDSHVIMVWDRCRSRSQASNSCSPACLFTETTNLNGAGGKAVKLSSQLRHFMQHSFTDHDFDS